MNVQTTVAAIQQIVGLFSQEAPVVIALANAVKGVIADHGVAADTSALDQVIADAERRKALAAADAQGVIATGSTGE